MAGHILLLLVNALKTSLPWVFSKFNSETILVRFHCKWKRWLRHNFRTICANDIGCCRPCITLLHFFLRQWDMYLVATLLISKCLDNFLCAFSWKLPCLTGMPLYVYFPLSIPISLFYEHNRSQWRRIYPLNHRQASSVYQPYIKIHIHIWKRVNICRVSSYIQCTCKV